MGSSCVTPCEYEVDALEHLLEAGDFGGQMLAAGGCDSINAHLAVGRRHTPLGPEQFGLEKALQRGVEGSFLYLQQVVRRLLDALHERIAVGWFLLQQAEHQHFEGPGEKVSRFGFPMYDYSSGRCIDSSALV